MDAIFIIKSEVTTTSYNTLTDRNEVFHLNFQTKPISEDSLLKYF